MKQPPGMDLTEQERSNVAAVHEHIEAANAAFAAGKGAARVAALLADDFTWCTPSSEHGRGVQRSRQLYLDIIDNPTLPGSPDAFATLQLKLLSTTAHGNRVAGESESYGVRNDGIVYHNYYHQLWTFDAAGKILNYKIYDDSKHVADVQLAGNVKKVLAYLHDLGSGAARLEVVPGSVIAQDNNVTVAARAARPGVGNGGNSGDGGDGVSNGGEILYQFVFELDGGIIKRVRRFRETED